MGKTNYKKENAKALERKKHELIKTICDDKSDMDFETFSQEVSKVEKINGLISNDKKPRMDGQTRAAIINGIARWGAIAMVMGWELSRVWSSRKAIDMATK
jgi:hypothetical protein